jgi:hypothetical protein
VKQLTIIAGLALFASPAAAGDVDLIKGQLSRSGDYARQTLGATNKTSVTLKTIRAECGFFRGDSLLASGANSVNNVLSSQTAYFDIIVHPAGDADRTDCRIVGFN